MNCTLTLIDYVIIGSVGATLLTSVAVNAWQCMRSPQMRCPYCGIAGTSRGIIDHFVVCTKRRDYLRARRTNPLQTV